MVKVIKTFGFEINMPTYIKYNKHRNYGLKFSDWKDTFNPHIKFIKIFIKIDLKIKNIMLML